jgi:3-deoxy-7-phosphoheptulonate synthase
MLESHLVEGKQSYNNASAATYGQSITDACLSWEETEPILDTLAAAIRTRRAKGE